MSLQQFFAKTLGPISFKSAQAVLELTKDGGTVPFIARYRKDKTGNLDEVQIRKVIETEENFNEIIKRKAFILKEIAEQNNLTDELKKRIEISYDLTELEEIYRPYKKKKKTKATIAREAGLDKLAVWIWDLGHGLIKDDTSLEVKAKNFLNVPAGIINYDLALKGAQDIIIEKIVNDAGLREAVKKEYFERSKLASKRTKNFKPNSKYEMYAEFSELSKNLFESKSSHRYLAMRRGWEEEELSVGFEVNEELLLKMYEDFATNQKDTALADYLKTSAKQALSVYVSPSAANELHKALKDKADEDAIVVFAENVKKVLLSSPFGPKIVLGVDPGLRTGCKVALLDKSGHFISNTVLHTLGERAEENAKKLFEEVLKQVQIEAIAVGNGTAGRQTENFIRKILKDIGRPEVPVIMVSESGASVYSASEVAREEFPDLDLTVKGAISIARRLQDPLSELVKVDPKSIGVGQYQHDVNQSKLKKSLDAVVESCVNTVGVDVNTASAYLLSYISGIGPTVAKNIVEARKKELFSDRSELMKIPKFSTKNFEQSAGFLRVPKGKVFLDSTGIHPERYTAIREMAGELGVGIQELVGDGAKKLLPLKKKWGELIGQFTFDDIVVELSKPGRDPRDPFKVFKFLENIYEVKDLKEGMICPGIVTNVTNFGAFVDVGVHQDGLVHISELSHKFIDDPRKVVNPGDQVTVRVIKVDIEKNQIAFSMKLESRPAEDAVARETRQNNGPNKREGDSRGRPPQSRGPQLRGQGDSRGRDDRGPRNENRNDNRYDNRGQGNRPAPAPKPAFNNPFAGLLDLNIKK